MKLQLKIVLFLMLAFSFIWANSAMQIDTYDATVVRSILDSIGWKALPIDSVIDKPSFSITSASSRVTGLNLAYRPGTDLPKIVRLPSLIGDLPELVSLSVNGNALTELPDQLTTLHKLKRLDCSSNGLKRFPDKLDELTLQRLDASFNTIDTLLLKPGSFPSLQILTMDHNRLRWIPDPIGGLSQLHSVSLASNKLTAIPATVSLLSNLTAFNLDSNQLTALPQELIALTNLKIEVGRNKLCSLDTAMARWLDSFHLTPDWRASQHCDSFVIESIVSDLTTGTVLHITDGNSVKAGCAPMVINPMEPSLISFPARRILKAVNVRFSECLTSGQPNFLITFTWEDFKDSLDADRDLSIYYRNSSGVEYIGGTVNNDKFTISLTSSRAGQYLLTTKPNPTHLRPVCRTISKTQAMRCAIRDHAIEASFALARPSSVSARLLTLQGRLVLQYVANLQQGTHQLRVHLPAFIRPCLRYVFEIRSKEFQFSRIVQM